MKDNNIDKVLSSLSKQLGMSENQIKNAAQKGNVEDLLKNMDSKHSNKIEKILSDPEQAQNILNSPQAQAIMRLLNNDENP